MIYFIHDVVIQKVIQHGYILIVMEKIKDINFINLYMGTYYFLEGRFILIRK
jgi:hypothetical protein